MARNVFISFLGATRYKPCRYYFENDKDNALPVESFVQAALIDSLRDILGEGDAAYFFLTKLAEETNWVDDGHTDHKTHTKIPGEGLHSRLIKLRQDGILKAEVQSVTNVPEGFSSEEMWNIFSLINGILQNNDKVYLDVTNAFRHIPMLTLSAMVYERANKNIKLCAVYYAIFEALGSSFDIDIRIPDPEKRLAPVLNLLSIEQLQQWSMATYDFEKNGTTALLSELTLKQTHSMHTHADGKDSHSALLRKLIKNLREITLNINTNRGREIEQYSGIAETREILKQLSSGTMIKPIEALLKKIESKVQELESPEHYPPWLKSAEWSLHHKLVQQGITQLQEGCVTYALQLVPDSFRLSYSDDMHRKLANNAFYYSNSKLENDRAKWKEINLEDIQAIEYILSKPHINLLAKAFTLITDIRNDINHDGFRKSPNKPNVFTRLLSTSIEKSKSYFNLIKQEFNQKAVEDFPKKFINISNHPITTWGADQIEAAKEYGKTEDLPFPQIPPDGGTEEIEKIANDYFENIVNEQDNSYLTVHLMGEQTFCYSLTQLLKSVGIKVVASTTRRFIKKEGNGEKTSVFQFVQFREY